MDNSEKHLFDEDAAREYIEKLRWPDGPVCPHCGVIGTVYRLPIRQGKKGPKREIIKCGSCRKQFSLLLGTIFEDSHIPLHKWLRAFHLFASSKKGFSAHQLHRTLKITYKSAWFMAHRVRYCMKQEPLKEMLTGIVEADEAYFGGKPRNKQPGKGPARGWLRDRKTPIVALVERGGKMRSFVTTDVTAANVGRILAENISPESHLMTDSAPIYARTNITKRFARHGMTDHLKGEYAKPDGTHSNTVESAFSLLKRGVYGTFHSISRKHLHRYAAEFDFRWNTRVRLGVNDEQRTAIALRQAEGRRLRYRQPKSEDCDERSELLV